MSSNRCKSMVFVVIQVKNPTKALKSVLAEMRATEWEETLARALMVAFSRPVTHEEDREPHTKRRYWASDVAGDADRIHASNHNRFIAGRIRQVVIPLTLYFSINGWVYVWGPLIGALIGLLIGEARVLMR
jgi:hypothetical protein